MTRHPTALIADDEPLLRDALERMLLRGMRYRVESAGGEFEVQSAPGEGTCVRARIPQRVAPSAAASTEAADPVDR